MSDINVKGIKVKEDNQQQSVDVNQQPRALVAIPDNLPVLPLRNLVLFPYNVNSISVGQARSLKLLEDVAAGNNLLATLAYKDQDVEEPAPLDLYQVGCIAQILRISKGENNHSTVLLQGLDKFSVDAWLSEKPYLRAKIHLVTDIEPEAGDIEAQAIRNNLLKSFSELINILSYLPKSLVSALSQTEDCRQLVYLVSSSMRMKMADAQDILNMKDVVAKMLKLTDLIQHEMEVLELGKKIQSAAHGEMDKAQRDYVLRHQMKAIQRELGEEDSQQIKIEQYLKKIEASGMSTEAEEQARQEISRLEHIPQSSSESGVILTYLDWLLALPWKKTTEDTLDIKQAEKILNEDHYGLEKIKQRILEYLAVRQLRQKRLLTKPLDESASSPHIRREREGVILCFVGPPGIGKTSLGHSIAHALGRKLVSISLGGIRDEAEIRGHRRTYIGAMPGRFIKALRDVGTNNPVILLDEVDKIIGDQRGDPASALLEILDPEQNSEFRDHYLEVAFDFSQLMFIATANQLDNIPGPLRDRLEVITLSGYTDDEKFHIAKRYLLPRQLRENSLHINELTISDTAMLTLIRQYTREAGVRSLDRRLGAICRKLVIKIATKSGESLTVDNAMLEELMGKPPFSYDLAERTERPGVATGLAVTAVGGDILFIEASAMPGKKGLTITGQLGDVMRESVEAGLSYVRSQAKQLGIAEDFFEHTDIHVHVPAGATPKDGPSAGVAIITALVSLLTDRPIFHHIGMTGEITLRGLVLPVGGIKDKILAAHRAGLTTVILPSKNEKDLTDLPESIQNEMRFVLAEHVDTVLDEALTKPIQ
ncbi:endopeptidase La [Colwellia sp. MB3u-70]|uniref:endopeptidase La n=1 Tax=unclassified Colwellia TaxID=196834 RepID=UPI0015F70AA5|nr:MULTISPECIES: endopeptidase La [unclassified Colwellia]MBA6292113.1 endopeptidase La [Colwellia sp. MB3u-8]MBA6309096.1 endopeptidase La [Colwellia sp. MB3u-70]